MGTSGWFLYGVLLLGGAGGGYLLCVGLGGPAPFRRGTGITEQEAREILRIAGQWRQLPPELVGAAMTEALVDAARRGKTYGSEFRFHIALWKEDRHGCPHDNPVLDRMKTHGDNRPGEER